MITKGNQRAGGQQLATHLLNEFDNEKVEVHDVRGTVAKDLHGAFAEWQCVSEGTQCTQYLYSLSINPWLETNGPLSREQYLEFIERTEERLKLQKQPRAIVFHVKEGREHCHVAWSRIDVDKMIAVPMSYDHQNLRTLVQEFAKDHNLELPDGLKNNNRKDRFKNKDKQPDANEKQQQDRTGISKAQHMAAITEVWRGSDSPKAFYEGLEASGYYLCQGDKNRYVLLDRFGEIMRSLPRMINDKSVNKKTVDAFLNKAYPVDKLRSIEQTRKYIELKKDNISAKLKEDFKIASDKWAHDLKVIQVNRQKILNEELAKIKARHKEEKNALKIVHQQSQNQSSLLKRILRQPPGIAATLYRVTGMHAIARFADKKIKEHQKRSQTHDRAALNARHRAELIDFQRRQESNELVNQKETRSLNAKLRRLERERLYTQPSKGDDERDLRLKKNLNKIKKMTEQQKRDNERGGR